MEPLSERNPRVVSAVKLLRGAERRKSGRVLVEGENSVAEVIGVVAVHDVFHTADAAARYGALLDRIEAAGIRASLVSDRTARTLSDTVTPPGIVAVADQVDVALDTVVGAGTRLLAVPVAIGEPGNAGTVIRVADAVGADGVVLAGDSVDPHNGKAVRASAGSLFHIPLARERDVDTVLDSLRAAGISILATAADGEVDLDEADEILARPTAWLFGSEAHGLPPDIAGRADHRVRIPIHGRAESLNLATAAAICLYSSARVQRRA